MKSIHNIPQDPSSVKANRPLELADLIAAAQAREDDVRSWLPRATARYPVGASMNVRTFKPWAANGYYRIPDDLDLAADHIIAIDQLNVFDGVYFTLNPCLPDLAARGPFEIHGERVHGAKDGAGDADIVQRNRLMIDLDPERPSGISSTEGEHAAALTVAVQLHDALREEFGFDHGVVASSGNGAHWLHPFEAENTEAVTEYVKAFLSSIERMVAELAPGVNVTVDQAVYNPARLCRVYGTMARKGKDTPDRPHRAAHILSDEEIRGVREGDQNERTQQHRRGGNG